METRLRPSTVLKRARQIVAEGRWCKGAEKNGDRFCAIGATREAAGCRWFDAADGGWYVRWSTIPNNVHRADRYLDAATKELYSHRYGVNGVTFMNDRVGTQRKQMLRIFDRAIEMAERDEKDKKNRKVRLARAAKKNALVSA